jgi:hypothetical protein
LGVTPHTLKFGFILRDIRDKRDFRNRTNMNTILITLENSVFATVFIVNYVLKVLIVPNVPFITKTKFSSVRSITITSHV